MGLASPFGVLCYSLEPIRKHWFTFAITRSPAGSLPESGQWSVRTFVASGKTIEAGTQIIQNRTVRYPMRRAAAGQAQLELTVLSASPSYSFFWEWMRQVYDDDKDEVGLLIPGGGIGGDGEVTLYNPSGGVVCRYMLRDIWPCNFTMGDVSHNGETDIASINVQFEVTECDFQG